MPFFCRELILIYRKFLCYLTIKRTTGKKKISYSLQVRIPLSKSFGRKGAFFFASASMTVEAALVLPLFLFMGVILMMPFRILDVERQMQAIVNSVGEEISQSACLTGGEGTEMSALASYAYVEGAVRMKARDLPVERLSLAGSKIMDDGETVNIAVTYQMKLPFSVFHLGSVERKNCCYLRAWVGRDGGTGPGSGSAAGEEEDDPIVYVGRNSTRYHVSASCHYLDNRLTTVSVDQIDNYRNAGGGRYTPCARCGGQAAGSVYIMPSGEHYHSSPSCSAIQAYVSAVRKSEVEHLGPCSYCSGG